MLPTKHRHPNVITPSPGASSSVYCDRFKYTCMYALLSTNFAHFHAMVSIRSCVRSILLLTINLYAIGVATVITKYLSMLLDFFSPSFLFLFFHSFAPLLLLCYTHTQTHTRTNVTHTYPKKKNAPVSRGGHASSNLET